MPTDQFGDRNVGRGWRLVPYQAGRAAWACGSELLTTSKPIVNSRAGAWEANSLREVTAKFDEDVLEVRLDGGTAHEQPGCDLRVGEPLRDQSDDLLLGRSEGGPTVARSSSFAPGPPGEADGLDPREGVSFDLGALRLATIQVPAGGRDRLVDRALFGGEAPAVLAFIPYPQGGPVQPKALEPAFGAAGGGGQSLQGVDDQGPQPVIGRDLQGVMPSVLVVRSGRLAGS